jgi:hypothetical protein
MIFGDKISHGSAESDKANRMSDIGGSAQPPQIDPFSFSALHFIRNRLMPTGEQKKGIL